MNAVATMPMNVGTINDEYTVPPVNGDASLEGRQIRDTLHRLLKMAGYTYSEIRSIWRRSYKDYDSLLTVCELLNTRNKVAVAYMLNVCVDSLPKRGICE